MNFPTIKKLAEYLKILSFNKTAYNAYFKWKKHIMFSSYNSRMQPFCEMCIKLHMESFNGIEEKILTDVVKYWSKKNCIFNKTFIE